MISAAIPLLPIELPAIAVAAVAMHMGHISLSSGDRYAT
jgi:hypothetical protein